MLTVLGKINYSSTCFFPADIVEECVGGRRVLDCGITNTYHITSQIDNVLEIVYYSNMFTL